MCLGFAVAGAAGGFAATYISHNIRASGLLIGIGGVTAGLVSFVVYVYVLTKIGK